MFRKICTQRLGRSRVECGQRATKRVYLPTPEGWVACHWTCAECAAELLITARMATVVR